MLQCLAIDDEPLALDLLEDNISKVPYLRLVAKCNDAFEAMEVMRHQSIDLIFVDVQIPGLTGLQFLESMTQKPMAILITAYQKFALEAYELNVVDYLVKPVELARFIAACNKALEWQQLRLAAAANNGVSVQPYIFVPVEYSLLKVLLSDILYIEGWKDYLKIYLQINTRPVLTRMSMKEMEETLPAGSFMRIHKSYIVSIDKLTTIKKNSILIGENEIPIGESYKESINQFTKKKM